MATNNGGTGTRVGGVARWVVEVLGLSVAVVALVVSCSALSTSTQLAEKANALAEDAVQRHALTASFPGCVFVMTASIEVGPNASGATEGGSKAYRILTNTGRLPVMVVGAEGVFGPTGERHELSLRSIMLPAAAEPSDAALYLEPGQAAAIELSYELPTPNDLTLDSITLTAADGSGDELKLDAVGQDGYLTTSIRRLYSLLGVHDEQLQQCSM